MNNENTKKLLERFPKLYEDYSKPMTQTCMCWGFDCGDGWFDIIWKLSEKLEKYDLVADQVKEKFGTLRFYYHYTSDKVLEKEDVEVHKAIRKTEKKSALTCEICGERGTTADIGGGWVSTFCTKCRKKNEEMVL